MNKRLIAALLVSLIIVLIAVLFFQKTSVNPLAPDQVYVGVAFGGNTVEEAKAIIDRTKNYTNLFILQSGPTIIDNQSATTEICNYANASGLNIIVYFNDFAPNILAQRNLTWRIDWVENAKTTYGNHFLGIYYYDERGGIYLDTNKTATGWQLPPNATYDTAASVFERGFLEDPGTVALKDMNVSIFCSDYALYWFDYRSGYDVVLLKRAGIILLPKKSL
jgi:hypothetical protein